MWGNRLGWIISGVIVLATGGMLALIVRGPARTGVTEFSADEGHFAALRWPEAPGMVGKALGGAGAETMAGAGTMGSAASTRSAANTQSGGTYREAIEIYLADRMLYDDFAAAGRLDSARVKRLKAIEVLVAASAGTSAAGGAVLGDRVESVINYAHTQPSLEALRALGRVLLDRLALLSRAAGDVSAAQRYAEAGFVLGQRLAEERLTYAELALGAEIQGKATALLIGLVEASGDAAGARRLKAFDAERQAAMREQVEPVARVVRSIDAQVVGRHAGDVFELAERSQERMWRVEAILALGRLRFFAGDGATASDQREAMRFVTELAERERDPAVRAAAIAARDLTAAGYRMQ